MQPLNTAQRREIATGTQPPAEAQAQGGGFRGLDASGRPVYGNAPRSATTATPSTAPSSAPVGVEDVAMAARNAENAIRNCAAAGQIGEGYVQYADDLRDAVRALAQQPATKGPFRELCESDTPFTFDPARITADALLAQQPAVAPVGVEDGRFPEGFADAIRYADAMEEAAGALYEKAIGPDDGSSTGTDLLEAVIRKLDAQQPAAVGGAMVERRTIDWVRIADALPPMRDERWSQTVWLALSSGQVMFGEMLMAHGRVHDWFVANHQVPDGVEVVAWMPFATPDHPTNLLQQETAQPQGGA